MTSPRIWTPPMDDPVNPNMHPLINRGITMLGVGIQQRLEQEGKSGAEGFSQYSNWWNGGMRSTPVFPQHRVDPDRGGQRPPRDAGRHHAGATAADAASGESAPRAVDVECEPVAGGHWSLPRSDGLHDHAIDGGVAARRRAPRRLALQPLSDGARSGGARGRKAIRSRT